MQNPGSRPWLSQNPGFKLVCCKTPVSAHALCKTPVSRTFFETPVSSFIPDPVLEVCIKSPVVYCKTPVSAKIWSGPWLLQNPSFRSLICKTPVSAKIRSALACGAAINVTDFPGKSYARGHGCPAVTHGVTRPSPALRAPLGRVTPCDTTTRAALAPLELVARNRGFAKAMVRTILAEI